MADNATAVRIARISTSCRRTTRWSAETNGEPRGVTTWRERRPLPYQLQGFDGCLRGWLGDVCDVGHLCSEQSSAVTACNHPVWPPLPPYPPLRAGVRCCEGPARPFSRFATRWASRNAPLFAAHSANRTPTWRSS